MRTLTAGEALKICDDVEKYVGKQPGVTERDLRKVSARKAALHYRAGDLGEAMRCLTRADGDEEAKDWRDYWRETQPPGKENYDDTPFTHPYYWAAFDLSGRVA